MQITAAALIAAGLAAGIGALIALHLAPTGLSALRGFYLGMTAWLVTVAVLLTLPAPGRPEHHFIGAARLQAAAIHPGRVCLTKPAGIGGGLSAASLAAVGGRNLNANAMVIPP